MYTFSKQSHSAIFLGAAMFTDDQIGQYFLVRRSQSAPVRLQLLAITGERGIFQIKNALLSIHYSNAIIEDPDQMDDLDDPEDNSDANEEWDAEAAEIERASNAFNQAQENFKPLVTAALKLGMEKVQKAISGLQGSPEDADHIFLEPLKQIFLYMKEKAAALDEEVGPFLCLPDENGPNESEIATAAENHINLFKPFFAHTMTLSKQADVLIHESVHSCLKVIDYAYSWQHIFRFLPLPIRLKNPDSYVAVARRFHGEEIETPRSTDDVYDYTVGMIQHICYRGSSLLKTRQKGLPSIQEMLHIIRPAYNEEQQECIIKIGTLLQIKAISGAIATGKCQLIYAKPMPTKLVEASVEIHDGTIIVSYIKPNEARPYVAILAKILIGYHCESKWAISVAKILDELTAQWHMPVIEGPSF